MLGIMEPVGAMSDMTTLAQPPSCSGVTSSWDGRSQTGDTFSMSEDEWVMVLVLVTVVWQVVTIFLSVTLFYKVRRDSHEIHV